MQPGNAAILEWRVMIPPVQIPPPALAAVSYQILPMLHFAHAG